MDHGEALTLATTGAHDLATLARPRERIDAVSLTTSRREHKLSTGRPQRGPFLSEAFTLVRLAHGGRDVYFGSDGLTGTTGPDLLNAMRALVPHGRTYQEAPPLRPSVTWNGDRFKDIELSTTPDKTLEWLEADLNLRAEQERNRSRLTMKVAGVVVTEQVSAEAFASSEGKSDGFARTWSEVKVLYEVSDGDRTLKIWAARNTCRIRSLDTADFTAEAAWRAGALLAAESGERPEGDVLLSPRTSATVLRLLTQDQFEREPPGGQARKLPRSLIDDPHASAGGHSRPFDHEGTRTAVTVLLDRTGTRAALVARGTLSPQAPHLTGHALRSTNSLTPTPLPTNVRLDDDAYAVPPDYTGLLGYGVRGGGGRGRHRAGDRLGFRVDVARVSQGEVVSRCPPLAVSASSPDLLTAIAAVSAPTCYFPGRHYSTAGSWMVLAAPATGTALAR